MNLNVLSGLSQIWCLVHVRQYQHLQHVANGHLPHQALLTNLLQACHLKVNRSGGIQTNSKLVEIPHNSPQL